MKSKYCSEINVPTNVFMRHQFVKCAPAAGGTEQTQRIDKKLSISHDCDHLIIISHQTKETFDGTYIYPDRV